MAILVVRTQVLENYAFPDYDGQGECPQNWKPKGGELYVIRDVIPDITEEKELLDDLEKYITQNDNYTQEYIQNFRMYPDGVSFSEFADEWENPIFLKPFVRCYIEKGIRDYFWNAKRMTYNDGDMRDEIEVKYESWVMKENNERDKYKAYYKMTNGAVYDVDQLQTYYDMKGE